MHTYLDHITATIETSQEKRNAMKARVTKSQSPRRSWTRRRMQPEAIAADIAASIRGKITRGEPFSLDAYTVNTDTQQHVLWLLHK